MESIEVNPRFTEPEISYDKQTAANTAGSGNVVSYLSANVFLIISILVNVILLLILAYTFYSKEPTTDPLSSQPKQKPVEIAKSQKSPAVDLDRMKQLARQTSVAINDIDESLAVSQTTLDNVVSDETLPINSENQNDQANNGSNETTICGEMTAAGLPCKNKVKNGTKCTRHSA